jgi:hypothetical protein
MALGRCGLDDPPGAPTVWPISSELTNKKLRRGAYRSVRALNADIRAWIEN